MESHETTHVVATEVEYEHAGPAPAEKPPKPTRSGACPYCLRNHLLRARGYAREVAEDPKRTWEAERLLENLLLAEDHAVEMGDIALKAQIREIRIPAEYGIPPTVAQVEPLLAQAREKILELHGVVDVGNKGEGTTIPAAPAKQ